MHALHHIGYWVDDLVAAQRRWREALGAGPFETLPHIVFDSFVLSAGGREHRDVTFDHSAAFAAWGPAVVELDCVHAIDGRLAAAYGYAPGEVSHVSWMVPDLGQESARLARLGCRLISVARAGPVHAAWHDGGPLFPHPIEVHQASSPVAGMHARLTALRDQDAWSSPPRQPPARAALSVCEGRGDTLKTPGREGAHHDRTGPPD